MIRKLRKKLVAVAMLSLFIVLFIIMGTVNITNYVRMVDAAERTITILKENNGTFPKPGGSGNGMPGHNMDMFKGMSPEAPYESRYFSVYIGSDGNVSMVDTGKIAGTDTDQAVDYAQRVLEAGRTSGFTGQYRYGVQSTDEGELVVFLYCGRELTNFRSVLLISVGISLAGMLAVLLLLIFFSGRIVKPVSESYEKQKRFITDAGHEIKTPLTIIDADAELVGLDCGENEWLEDIKKQTKRLTALTNDLIYLAKMEEGGTASAKIDFPLSDVVLETADSFRARAVNENKELDIKIQPGLSYCGDEKAIRQLISILVDNAVKYSDGAQAIEVSLNAAGGTAKQGRTVKLQVYNSCDSIDTVSVKHLFDRFYRAEQSRNSQTGGYGIGLSVAKAVVEAHKGRIMADSADGKSLRITVIM